MFVKLRLIEKNREELLNILQDWSIFMRSRVHNKGCQSDSTVCPQYDCPCSRGRNKPLDLDTGTIWTVADLIRKLYNCQTASDLRTQMNITMNCIATLRKPLSMHENKYKNCMNILRCTINFLCEVWDAIEDGVLIYDAEPTWGLVKRDDEILLHLKTFSATLKKNLKSVYLRTPKKAK